MAELTILRQPHLHAITRPALRQLPLPFRPEVRTILAPPGTSILRVATVNPSQVPPSASLLAVPVVGAAPLTVDFYVGLADTPSRRLYEWNFGDRALSVIPVSAYMLHVYQHPGTYLCSLELINVRGLTSTVYATITVKPGG